MVPTYALTDNEKTVTVEHVCGIAVRNATIVEVSRHYGLTIATCEPADPQSKGGSEATVKLAKADLVPTDHNLRDAYADWQALEQACQEFMADVNTRPHRATRQLPVPCSSRSMSTCAGAEGQRGARQDVGRFECSNVPSVGILTIDQSIEKLRSSSPPYLQFAEVACVPTVLIVALVRIQPPRNTETVTWRQGPKDTELQIVTDVPNVAVLHGQMTARRTPPKIVDPIIAGAAVAMPMAFTVCTSTSTAPPVGQPNVPTRTAWPFPPWSLADIATAERGNAGCCERAINLHGHSHGRLNLREGRLRPY